MRFFDSLFDSKGATKTANDVAAARSEYANQGYKQAEQRVGDARTSALGYIDPYVKSGRQGYERYNDAIGINGEAGYGRAFQNFNADPFLAGSDESTQNALSRQFQRYNARGMGNSGASRLAMARTNSDMYGQRVNDYRQRLAGAGQQGAQFAQYGAGLETDYGNRMADYAIGRNNALAGAESDRLTGIQTARDRAAGNLLGFGTGLAGLAISGFAPGAGGKSAFGNMASGFRGLGGAGSAGAVRATYPSWPASYSYG